MKKFIYLLSFACLSLISLDANCQDACLDIGIFNNPVGSNKLEIRLKPNQDVLDKDYTGGRFTVRYPASSGVSLSVLSTLPYNNKYSYFKTAVGNPVASTENTIGIYTYVVFNSSPGSPPKLNLTAGTEEVILTLQISGIGTNSVPFELVTGISETSVLGGLNGDYYQELNGNADVGAQNIVYNTSTAVVLPIELLSFKAEKEEDKTAVQWDVINEKDLTYYAVERSIDGSNFKTIDIEKPRAKNENEKVRYGFLDEKPDLGVNYYRLQLKDLNDQVTYSKTVSVDFGSKIKAKTYPNPFSTDLSVEIDIEKNIKGDVLIDLLDMTGKIVQTKKLVAQGRRVNFNLPTNDLVPGTYVIRMKNGNDTWQQKITKQ